MTANIERGEKAFVAILQIVTILMFLRIIAALVGCVDVDHPVGWEDAVDVAVGTAVLVDVENATVTNTKVGEASSTEANVLDQIDVQEPRPVEDMGFDFFGNKQRFRECEIIDGLTCCMIRDELGQLYRTCTWKLDMQYLVDEFAEDIPGC